MGVCILLLAVDDEDVYKVGGGCGLVGVDDKDDVDDASDADADGDVEVDVRMDFNVAVIIRISALRRSLLNMLVLPASFCDDDGVALLYVALLL